MENRHSGIGLKKEGRTVHPSSRDSWVSTHQGKSPKTEPTTRSATNRAGNGPTIPDNNSRAVNKQRIHRWLKVTDNTRRRTRRHHRPSPAPLRAVELTRYKAGSSAQGHQIGEMRLERLDQAPALGDPVPDTAVPILLARPGARAFAGSSESSRTTAHFRPGPASDPGSCKNRVVVSSALIIRAATVTFDPPFDPRPPYDPREPRAAQGRCSLLFFQSLLLSLFLVVLIFI